MLDPTQLNDIMDDNEIIPARCVPLVVGKHKDFYKNWANMKREPLLTTKVFGLQMTTVTEANRILKSLNLTDKPFALEDFRAVQ